VKVEYSIVRLESVFEAYTSSPPSGARFCLNVVLSPIIKFLNPTAYIAPP